MKAVYQLCRISKQSHHQAVAREAVWQDRELLYVGFIEEIRNIHPNMGLRIMHEHYQPEGIGRDIFIELGIRYGYRVAICSNPRRTTHSIKHLRYENLLACKTFTSVNQVWSSDITYFELAGKFYYIVLILDVYSRRLIGYNVADNMRAENNVAALRMALNLRGVGHYKYKLIHHSDRGAQYISNDYTNLLEEHGIQISMCTEVLENAHIERANGIIKNDYLAHWNLSNQKQLRKALTKAVEHYNQRPHQSLPQKMTPLQFETYVNELTNDKRPALKIFTYFKNVQNQNQMKFNF